MTETSSPADWAAELEQHRAEKDEFFAEHPQSPIPPDDRDGFDGLSYFEPDASYRVDATVSVHEDPETVTLETSDGLTIDYRREVTFSFQLDGAERTLHGYRKEAEDPAIFVPLRDETSGTTTYEGGRYMELEPAAELQDGDVVTIDFNLAYSLFCAFSETFSCPLPPAENHLETAIRAGERLD